MSKNSNKRRRRKKEDHTHDFTHHENKSNKKKENKETATGYVAYYISFLFFWAVIGGLLTLSPYLNNKASFIGNISIFSWLALPITILFSMDNKKPSIKTLFSLNIIIWAIFTYIVWAKASI